MQIKDHPTDFVPKRNGPINLVCSLYDFRDRICLLESRIPFLMECRKGFLIIAIRKTLVGSLGIVTVPEEGTVA